MKKTLLVLLVVTLGITACAKKEKAQTRSLEQIYAEEGVPVELVTLAPQTFTQEINYNSDLNFKSQSTEHALISAQVKSVLAKVGDRVKEGQVIVTFPDDNVSTSYAQAQAQTKLYESTYQRMQALYQSGGISKQDLDNAETQYKVSVANLKNSRKTFEVTAPISGVITQINVLRDQAVSAGDPLFTVSQNTNDLEAMLYINEGDITKLKLGMPAIAYWQGQTYQGKVSEITWQKDVAKMAFPVRVNFANPDHRPFSGMTADVHIVYNQVENAIAVDRSLVITTGDKKSIWTAVNNQAVKKEITVGADNGQQVLIAAGLNAGDQIITSGYNLVWDNAKLKTAK